MEAEHSEVSGEGGSHFQRLLRIGLALSAERDLDRLLETIVLEARRFTNADGGTLYLRDEERGVLDFAIVQNESLGTYMGGTAGAITWPPVPLTLPGGGENHGNVSAHCALIKEAVNIPDVYRAEGFDFEGTRAFDASTGFRSQSMLLMPLVDHEDEVTGVLQLLNARDRKGGAILPFPDKVVEFVSSLASQAAIAVNTVRLIKGLEELLGAFVKSIAAAIDAKSPYTAGHIARVAGLCSRISEEISGAAKGPFASVAMSKAEREELQLAALMHDEGKISTPDHIVDKATKLESVFDRIELVRHRFELLKREAEISRLRKRLAAADSEEETEDEAERGQGTYDEDLEFLAVVNRGGEFLLDEKIERIRKIASLTYEIAGRREPLLTADEMENLSVRHGTLRDQEREIINNHVALSLKMLEGLPFPRKLRKVPEIAGMHHERLDGSGYPRGLRGDQIPLRARILAVADVFEALTASDRPYSPGKKLSEAMKILGLMVRDRHLDGDICDLLVESGLIWEYGRQVLPPRQIDGFEWRGKNYSAESGR